MTYEEVLRDVRETRTIDAGVKKIEIEFSHYPNMVGKRSKFTGLPIWVGKTVANAPGATEEALCWVNEPYAYAWGRVVSAGRVLKKLGLSTKLAEQARE